MNRTLGYLLALLGLFVSVLLTVCFEIGFNHAAVAEYCAGLKSGMSQAEAEDRALLVTFRMHDVVLADAKDAEFGAVAYELAFKSKFLHACVMRFDQASGKLKSKTIETTEHALAE